MTGVCVEDWVSGDDVLGLFGGPGGWLVAGRWLGLHEIGVEIEPNAAATEIAAGFDCMLMDVRDVHPRKGQYKGLTASPPCQSFSKAGKGLGRASLPLLVAAVLWMGEGLSVADATKGMNLDERSTLVLEPLRAILECGPEWIALEQVPSVLPIWQAYAEVLRQQGYSVDVGLLNAEQFGVPQTRKRAILVANRARDCHLPVPTHSKFYSRDPKKLDPGVPSWVSMATALGWGMTERPYPAIAPGTAGGGTDPQAIGGSGSRKTVAGELREGRWIDKTWDDSPDQWQRSLEYVGGNQNHATRRHQDQPAPAIAFGHAAYANTWQYVNGNQEHAARRTLDNPAPTVHFGARVNTVTWEQRKAVAGEVEPRVNNQSGTEFDLSWPIDRPSPVIAGREIVTMPGANANRFNGRTKSRNDGIRVSVAEAACLQSFPGGYPWQGNKTSQYEQVGNAICPVLAEAILRSAIGMDPK
jgi:DNA (cytosine-5)-methyltransferase 1